MLLNKGLFSVRGFVFYWCVTALLFMLAAFFAGIGYALLVLATEHTILRLSDYWDRLGFVIMGRERYLIMMPSIIRFRESTRSKILFIFSSIVWFAFVIWVICVANVRFIDFFY